MVIDGNLTARRHIDEDPSVILPFLKHHVDVTLYQQDNASTHSARLTSNFLGQYNVQAFSPDLSPIEYLWDQLGRRMFDGRRRIHNRQQLIQALTGYSAIQNSTFDLQYKA